MKDFTKKGTKLPVIPVGTGYRCTSWKGNNMKLSFIHDDFYSFGKINTNGIECILAEVKGYKGDCYFVFKLYTIERLAKEQGMCNTNNEIEMNPKVTLQENGEVTVTDTETTTTLSKVTVDEICRLVKEQPKLRKINVWYGSKEYPKLCWRSDESNCYGLNWKGNWEFKSRNSKELSTLTDDDYELSPETVEQYLKAEAVKKGYKKGVKIKNHQGTFTLEDLDIVFNTQYNDGIYTRQGSGVWLCMNGVWSEIIQPETITRAEAEKRYDVKITD